MMTLGHLALLLDAIRSESTQVQCVNMLLMFDAQWFVQTRR